MLGSSRVYPIYPIAWCPCRSQIPVGSQRARPYGERDPLRQRTERRPGSVIVRSDYGEHRDIRRTSDRRWRRALELEDRACADGTVEVDALRGPRERFGSEPAPPWTPASG